MINLGGDASTLEVRGEEHVRVYRADTGAGPSEHGRYFCVKCGSHLWAKSERWPDLVHPVASAIDTPLPKAPEPVHMMVGSKADWVPLDAREGEAVFDTYPNESLAGFHAARAYSDE